LSGGREHVSGTPAGFFELRSFNVVPSPGLAGWLAENRVGIALTTGDRMLLLGARADGGLALDERSFESAAGLAAVGSQTLYLATRWQLHRFENAVSDRELGPAGNDRLYLAQTAYTTGFVGIFDVAVDGLGRPLFTTALVNCVSTVADRANFMAVWRPPFISALVSGDRCHLTGLALEDGELAYVTCGAATDEESGWRERIADGGVVVDVRAGAILAEGLSLPHSPRLHDGQLYVTAGGTGELVRIDRQTGEYETVASVDGLARGLAFAGGCAIVGCSRAPEEGSYVQAPVFQRVPADEQRHGLSIIELESGEELHSLDLLAGSGEVFSIAALSDTIAPGFAEVPGGLYDQLSIGSSSPSRRQASTRGAVA
jgi:uncharacterized protein (TIGR03032 family)